MIVISEGLLIIIIVTLTLKIFNKAKYSRIVLLSKYWAFFILYIKQTLNY